MLLLNTEARDPLRRIRQQKVSYVPELFFADLGSGPGARSARYERILVGNIGALMIRIGSWGPLYYDDNKEPLKTGLVIL